MDDGTSARTGRIRTDTDGGIRRIVVDNPRRYNAMSYAMWNALAEAVEEAGADPAVRVVVLSGAGETAFVSGADISEFGQVRDDPDQVAAYDAAVDRALEALKACPRPTVASIRGICMGGGMGLALSCDLRYAAADTRLRMPAGRLGVGYGRDGIQRFADMVGPARTADLFLTARVFDGAEAARIGFAHEVFAPDVFEAQVEERVAAVAANAPLTLASVKATLRHLMDEPGAPGADEVDAGVRACFESEDYRIGRDAFVEKRRPVFTGR